MVMVDALDAKVAESLAAYRTFHAEWEPRLAWQESYCGRQRRILLLADVPYLTLAAAARLQIPALALCSLNWADILAGYCADAPDLAELRAPMLAAYNAAPSPFAATPPSMPMPDLHNARTIGPIAGIGPGPATGYQSPAWVAGKRDACVDGTGRLRNAAAAWKTWPRLPECAG
jgi:hypothetical protein